MRTIFVTGGAGYVGSHCCKAFARAGWRVVVYDSLYRGWRDLARFGELVEGDILDLPRLTAAMVEARPDVVAHFAALTYVGESVEDPARYYENNSKGTWNILAAMREAGCSKIIFLSASLSQSKLAMVGAISSIVRSCDPSGSYCEPTPGHSDPNRQCSAPTVSISSRKAPSV